MGSTGIRIKQEHKFPYKWNLSDGYPAKGIEKNNLNVFGTFICGGGSTMGYKLAGFNHLGGVEIDPKIADVYKANHNPKYLFVEDIRRFNERTDLSDELYNLDILDGSPPCSTFSMAGSREKAWGKSKKFREGQANQILDDLVFTYCDTIIKLKPKVAILENVKGLIQANARAYCNEIIAKLANSGYTVQVFLLNAASMGVPQKRERVFFICRLKSLNLPDIRFMFEEKVVCFSQIKDDNCKTNRKIVSETIINLWNKRTHGDLDISCTSGRVDNRPNHFFNWNYIYTDKVPNTITGDDKNILFDECRYLSKSEIISIGTFPQDYNFTGNKPDYLIGMSVPPVMIAQIAHQIYLQWLKK